jgi:hypothetical protein
MRHWEVKMITVYVVDRPGRPLSVRTTRPRLRPGWTIREAVIRPESLRRITS